MLNFLCARELGCRQLGHMSETVSSAADGAAVLWWAQLVCRVLPHEDRDSKSPLRACLLLCVTAQPLWTFAKFLKLICFSTFSWHIIICFQTSYFFESLKKIFCTKLEVFKPFYYTCFPALVICGFNLLVSSI